MLTGFTMVALWPVQADAQIYKWVDAQGKVHFSNHPMYADRENSEQVELSGLESAQTKENLGKQVWQQQCSQCHYIGYGQEGEKTGASAILVDDYREKMLSLDEIIQNIEQTIVDKHLTIVQPVPNDAQIRALAEAMVADQQAYMAKKVEPAANSANRGDAK